MKARFGSVLAFLLAAPPAALASDGVFEISPACVPAGCFPGDSAGLPVVITSPGSYRLTGPLLVPDPNTTAILIQASDVAIDLGGFRIQGPNQCSGKPLTCTAPGTGDGIAVDDRTLRARIEVRGGSVVGMGNVGISLGSDCAVRDIRAAQNGDSGISVHSACTIAGNVASSNGDDGIECLSACVAEGNSSRLNAARGLSAIGTIRGNASHDNGTHGILAGAGSTVVDNSATSNDEHGYLINSGSVVSRNSARSNGGDGIHSNGTSGGLLVQSNSVNENGGFGLALAPTDAYLENTIEGNDDGTVTGGVSRGNNFCDGAATPNCP